MLQHLSCKSLHIDQKLHARKKLAAWKIGLILPSLKYKIICKYILQNNPQIEIQK